MKFIYDVQLETILEFALDDTGETFTPLAGELNQSAAALTFLVFYDLAIGIEDRLGDDAIAEVFFT